MTLKEVVSQKKAEVDLHNEEGVFLAKARIPYGLLGRAKGLIGHAISEFECMAIPKCTNIHTFFMLAPIDVVYCNDEDEVVDLRSEIPPWRVSLGPAASSYVLEFRWGTIADKNFKIGNKFLYL